MISVRQRNRQSARVEDCGSNSCFFFAPSSLFFLAHHRLSSMAHHRLSIIHYHFSVFFFVFFFFFLFCFEVYTSAPSSLRPTKRPTKKKRWLTVDKAVPVRCGQIRKRCARREHRCRRGSKAFQMHRVYTLPFLCVAIVDINLQQKRSNDMAGHKSPCSPDTKK